MSLTETPTEPPKPRHRRPNKRRRRPAVAAPAKSAGIYAGMTPGKCPSGCNEKGCVITATPFCGHPHKGASLAAMPDADARSRFTAAQRYLGEQKLDLTSR